MCGFKEKNHLKPTHYGIREKETYRHGSGKRDARRRNISTIIDIRIAIGYSLLLQMHIRILYICLTFKKNKPINRGLNH
jgi:hypothetical protein